jgi:hypothetical protein
MGENVFQLFIWQGTLKMHKENFKNPKTKSRQTIWIDNSQKKKYKCPINIWKILNIISYKGDTNQNCIEIPPHTC